MEDIAYRFKKSRTYVSNLVNTSENGNFNTFINKLRIAEAERLIKSRPELTLSEVANAVGYSEQSNFTKQFRLVTGKTPSQFRKDSFAGKP